MNRTRYSLLVTVCTLPLCAAPLSAQTLNYQGDYSGYAKRAEKLHRGERKAIMANLQQLRQAREPLPLATTSQTEITLPRTTYVPPPEPPVPTNYIPSFAPERQPPRQPIVQEIVTVTPAAPSPQMIPVAPRTIATPRAPALQPEIQPPYPTANPAAYPTSPPPPPVYAAQPMPTHPYYAQSAQHYSPPQESSNVDSPMAGMFSSDMHELEIGIQTGWRRDELQWNIAGNTAGTSPNILSELTWDDIDSIAVEGGARYRVRQGLFKGLEFEGSVMHSDIYNGDVQDSDYLSDNRQNEFSRSNNSADTGWSHRYRGSVGYGFEFGKNRLYDYAAITPFVGYELAEQRFVLRDGFQTIPATGSFANLRSKYQTEWSGPFIGGKYESRFANRHHFRFNAAYHFWDYEAQATWNLRSDFQQPLSYEQFANAGGWTIGMLYGYEILPSLELSFRFEFEHMESDKGLDRTYLSAGGTAETRLNEVEWKAQMYSIGLSYLF